MGNTLCLRNRVLTAAAVLLGCLCFFPPSAHALLNPTLVKDYPYTSYELWGIAYHNGTYLVSDSLLGGGGPSHIYEYNSSFDLVGTHDFGGYLNGLTIDSSGNVYVFDQGADSLIKYASNFAFIASNSSGYGGSYGPRSLTYYDGFIYALTNQGQSAILKIDPATLAVVTTLNGPTNLTGISWAGDSIYGISADGYLYQLLLQDSTFTILNTFGLEGLAGAQDVYTWQLAYDGTDLLFADLSDPTLAAERKIYSVAVPTPEPGTFALLFVGLALSAGYSIKRRRVRKSS